MTDLTTRLSKCYASAIHDVLREKGYQNCVLPPEIQALQRGQKLFGEIFTVSGHVDTTLSDISLYFYGLKFYPRFQIIKLLFVNLIHILLLLWENYLHEH